MAAACRGGDGRSRTGIDVWFDGARNTSLEMAASRSRHVPPGHGLSRLVMFGAGSEQHLVESRGYPDELDVRDGGKFRPRVGSVDRARTRLVESLSRLCSVNDD